MKVDVGNKSASNGQSEEPTALQDGQQHLEETCAEPLIDRWLQGSATDVGQHSVMILSEGPGTRVCLAAELHDTFRDHYMSQETCLASESRT